MQLLALCVVVICLLFAHLLKQPPAKLDIGCRTKNYTNRQICCGEARTCRPRSSIESGASCCVFLLHQSYTQQRCACKGRLALFVNSYNYPRRVRPRDWGRRAMQAALSTGTHLCSSCRTSLGRPMLSGFVSFTAYHSKSR